MPVAGGLVRDGGLAHCTLASFVMGAWFYMTAVGNFVAGKIGEATGGRRQGEMSRELVLDIYWKIAGSRSDQRVVLAVSRS